MLCHNLCQHGTLGNDACETMGGSVTMYADFVDSVINPFVVRGQCKVMPAMKSAEVYSFPKF